MVRWKKGSGENERKKKKEAGTRRKEREKATMAAVDATGIDPPVAVVGDNVGCQP